MLSTDTLLLTISLKLQLYCRIQNNTFCPRHDMLRPYWIPYEATELSVMNLNCDPSLVSTILVRFRLRCAFAKKVVTELRANPNKNAACSWYSNQMMTSSACHSPHASSLPRVKLAFRRALISRKICASFFVGIVLRWSYMKNCCYLTTVLESLA